MDSDTPPLDQVARYRFAIQHGTPSFLTSVRDLPTDQLDAAIVNFCADEVALPTAADRAGPLLGERQRSSQQRLVVRALLGRTRLARGSRDARSLHEQAAKRLMGYQNPLMDLPEAQALLALPADQRAAIEALMRGIRREANELAEKSWASKKGPMAAYWRAVSTYARHVAILLKKGSAISTQHPPQHHAVAGESECPLKP